MITTKTMYSLCCTNSVCSSYISDIVKDTGPDDELQNIDNELELVDDEPELVYDKPEPVQPADDNEQDIATALEQYQAITQYPNVSQSSPSTHSELFICGCTLAEGKPCSKQFSNGYLLEARLNSMELTRKELDLVLLGALNVCCNKLVSHLHQKGTTQRGL